ncbi:putative transcription factor SBP family [Helianthus debilis subsp. tardiflorus]
MDRNLNTPTEWDWNMPFSSHENVVVDNLDFSFSASVNSSKETIKTLGAFDDLPNDFLENEESSWLGENENYSNMVEEVSVLSGEAMIGLKIGKHACTSSRSNNMTATESVPLFPTSPPMIKRSRSSYLSSQSPHCQVEGCNLDLSSAKDYHRHHRICSNHSRSPKVIVGGMERRFCQQCSRFHDLSEFDDKKRSCRRRLSAHNARRRRPQSEEIHFSSNRMSSSICDRKPQMNFLLNRGTIPISDSAQPERSCNFKGKESLGGLGKGGGIDVFPINGTLNFSSERFMPRNTNLNGMEPTSNSILPGDVNNAFSLLSTSSWSSSWPDQEPLSFDQFSYGNSISLAQPLDLQDTTSNTQLQDFQSFRSPHEFERFYSN